MYKHIDISKESPESMLCYVDNLGYEDDTEGKETLHIRLFFTEIPLSDQWGDDWDDAPYECNASEPYDDLWLNGERVEHTIYICDAIVNAFEQRHLIKLPSDYGYNSPFSVDDINNDAVAWMYRPYVTKKGFRKTIHAGASPKDVYDFLKDIFIECVKEEE